MRNSKRSLRLSKYENLSVSFDDMGDQDKEINSLLEDVKKKIKLNVRIEKIPFYSDNYIFPLIIYSIKKDKKNALLKIEFSFNFSGALSTQIF